MPPFVSRRDRLRLTTSCAALLKASATRPPTSPAPAIIVLLRIYRLHHIPAIAGDVSIRPMNPASNLILIGPMGAGKTSIGRRLASLLDLNFVDADYRLEEVTGVAVPLIFECEGEAGFRQRESQLIAELCQGKNQLIATGGGAVLSPENRRQLQTHGFVVYLQVTVEQQLERLSRDRSRPLLAGGDKREKLLSLSEIRHPLYLEIADLVYRSGDNSVVNAVAGLQQQLLHHWQRAEAA